MSSFVGNDRRKWVSGAPTFGRVSYPHLWPGVDGVFYGNQRRLEYDLRVAPGASPSSIVLGFSGQRSARLAANGDLLLRLPGGRLVRELAPVSYQQVGGSRVPVASRFVLSRSGRVGVALGAYDHQRPLVIDPALAYSTYLGGIFNEGGQGIAVDASGSAYVTGTTNSTNFPTSMGAFQSSKAASNDVFVSKLNAAGSALTYSTFLGGSTDEVGTAIAVDSNFNAYVTGWTTSSDFPRVGALQTTYGGNTDGFVSKLNATGSVLTYSTYLGGSGTDQGNGIAVDSNFNAYVTGITTSANFQTTTGALQTSNAGGQDAFVSKLNATGSALTYSTYLGGSGFDVSWAIAVDSSGAAYVTGYTGSTNFPTTPGALQTSNAGSNDAFVSKLNAAGSALTYSTYVGGNGTEEGKGIAIDTSGNAYIAGFTESTNFPTTPGAFQTTLAGGGQDAVVFKLNATGTALTYSTYLGGSGFDYGRGIGVDSSGNAYVTGYTSSTNFPTSTGALQTTYGGGPDDAFVFKLNATGSALTYSTYLGGSGDDFTQGLAVDSSGAAYVTGSTNSTNFPTSPGAFQTANAGNYDAFVTKLSPNPTAVGFVRGRARLVRGGGVEVLWWAGAGSQILGFDVLRAGHHHRVRVLNHRGMVAGTALSFGAASDRGRFAFFDRSGRRGERYLIRVVYLSGRRQAFGPFIARGRRVRRIPVTPILGGGTL